MSKVRTKDLGNGYYEKSYKNITIICNKDGLYNLANLCSLAGKRFSNWIRNSYAQQIIKKYAEIHELEGGDPKKFMSSVSTGDNKLRGTYGVYQLANCIAGWISPDFRWIIDTITKNWMNESTHNENIYYDNLGRCLEISKNEESDEKTEHKFRDMVAKEENGKTEVKVKTGFIDVLTETKIIEIKKCSDFKHATGQIWFYGREYPDKEKWIYFFDHEERSDKKNIIEGCGELNINVKFID